MDLLKLVLVVGPSGTGKSWLARRLAHELRFHWVETEKIKEAIGYRPIQTVAGSGNNELRRKAYYRIYDQIFHHLTSGRSVVSDAPHNVEMADPNFLENLARWMRVRDIRARVKIIVRLASPSTVRKNIRGRAKVENRPQDLQKLVDWKAFQEGELKKFVVIHPHLVVRRPKAEFQTVVKYIRDS